MVEENEYTNREIDRMFGEIMTTLHRIEEQTVKTNGRVSKLELWRETFMAKVGGVVATISLMWLLAKQFIFKTA